MLWTLASGAGWSSSEIARTVAARGRALPLIDFIAEAVHCAVCKAPLRMKKSTRRTALTYFHGAFDAREVVKECEENPSHPVARSAALQHLVRPRQRFGYDLIVHIGLARYLRGMQREEIREELRRERGIELSSGSISNLCDRFLLYLEALHLVRAPCFKAEMQELGYPLHIDATSEHGKGGLFVCIDGFRGWVLFAKKIETESETHLTPIVERTVNLFGDPLAVVRDLGEAGRKAVAPLRKRGVPDLVCHYHFLGALGKKLFDNPYALLRSILRQSRIRSNLRELLKDLKGYRQADSKDGRFGPGRIREDLLALVHWILEGDGKKDAPYPFCLPHLDFFMRCRDAMRRAERWAPTPRSQAERRALGHLEKLMNRLEKDKRIDDAASRLEKGWRAFCELRNILRLTDSELPRGDKRYDQALLPVLEMKRLEEIEKSINRYIDDLHKRVGNESLVKPKTTNAIILKYFKRYGENLFGHPVIRDEDGTVIAITERTNNKAEHYFGGEKQHLRRRLGRANLGRDLEDQPAQAALTANLSHPDYVRILCGSLDNLPAAFANLDEQALSQSTPLVRSNRDTELQRRVRSLLEHLELPSLADEIEPDSAQIGC